MADAAPAFAGGAADKITSLDTVAIAPTPMFNKAKATTRTVRLLPMLATSKNAAPANAIRIGISTCTCNRCATGTTAIPTTIAMT
ncbi:hypothetical protein D9M71_338240 [compost metagenome]